jgi:hypothetical protein
VLDADGAGDARSKPAEDEAKPKVGAAVREAEVGGDEAAGRSWCCCCCPTLHGFLLQRCCLRGCTLMQLLLFYCCPRMGVPARLVLGTAAAACMLAVAALPARVDAA